MNTAEWLFGTADKPSRLGEAWLRFFKIPKERFPVFHLNLLAAAGFHDWGKANNGFQDMLWGKGEQIIRHEHLSGLLLAPDPVTNWLKQRPDLDADIVLSAVLTHHLKIKLKEFAVPIGPRTTLYLLADHPDFPVLIREVGKRVGLPEKPPELPRSPFWAFRDSRGMLPAGVNDLAAHREKVIARRLRPFELALREEDAGADVATACCGRVRGLDRRRRRRVRPTAGRRKHAYLDREDVRFVPAVR